MDEFVYEYEHNGNPQISEEPIFNGYRIGDLVTWTADDDIGIVLDATNDDSYENIYIRWTVDTGASGWHGPHPSLKLLSSH